MKNDINKKSKNTFLPMKKDYCKEIQSLIKEIKSKLGGNVGFHIMLATEGSNLEFLPDKEFAFQLEKYLSLKELDMDSQILSFDEDIYEEYE